MSFTATDKENIRRWLGYPAEVSHIQFIESRCNEAAVVAPAVVVTVQAQLRELGRIEQETKSGRPFADRTLTSNAGGTTQRSPSFSRDYRQEQVRQYINEISLALNIPVRRNPFDRSSGWSSSGKIVRS